MDPKEFIQKEKNFSYYEYQLKFRTNLEEGDILKSGARRIGSVLHEDKYFIPKDKSVSETSELIRLRKEGGENLLFTYKGPVANKKYRNRLVINKIADKKEVFDLKSSHKEVVGVNKKRVIFISESVIINLDKVENLGNFIELEVAKEKDCCKIENLAEKLGLDPHNSTRLSYFELAMMNLSPWQRLFTKVCEKLGKFSFGISSAVLTTLGVVVTLNTATASLIAVIGGIVAVAIADSLSDSMGMYASKKAERGISPTTALRSAINVFSGKFIFTLTFIIPFIIFPYSPAIYICIVWGLLLLAFVNIQIAFVQEENIIKSVMKNLLFAVFVIIISYFAGWGITLLNNL